MKPKTILCVVCNTCVTNTEGVGASKKYCSKECAHRFRYLQNRDELKTKALARYYENRDPTLTRSRNVYFRISKPGHDKIRRMFTLLNIEQREDYAEWLLFLAGADSTYMKMINHWLVDDWLADYAVSAG